MSKNQCLKIRQEYGFSLHINPEMDLDVIRLI